MKMKITFEYWLDGRGVSRKIEIDDIELDDISQEKITEAFKGMIGSVLLSDYKDVSNDECDCEKGQVRGTRLDWMESPIFRKEKDGTWTAIEKNGDAWTAPIKDSILWEEINPR